MLLPLPSFWAAEEVPQTKTNNMQLLCLHVPRTGSAHWCLKNKHIAKALCFQWQDGWEKCQPLAITLLSCQLLAAMRMYFRYLLRKELCISSFQMEEE